MIGRTVRLFLVDGTPKGILTAEIMNWTGQVTLSPRSRLSDLAAREEVKRTGIYILAGPNPDNPIQQCVYIGESDNVWKRLTQHNADPHKDFWEHSVVITSKDANLTKAHVRYLESKLISIAALAERAILINGTKPEILGLPESDIADMDFFLEQIQILLPVLGFNFALPIPVAPSSNHLNNRDKSHISPTFIMNYNGVEAQAREADGEFILLAQSQIKNSTVPSFPESLKSLRNQLFLDGHLVDTAQGQYWVLMKDIPFGSPSSAAKFVGGASLNGRVMWKTVTTGMTYAEWQEQAIQQADDLYDEDLED